MISVRHSVVGMLWFTSSSYPGWLGVSPRCPSRRRCSGVWRGSAVSGRAPCSISRRFAFGSRARVPHSASVRAPCSMSRRFAFGSRSRSMLHVASVRVPCSMSRRFAFGSRSRSMFHSASVRVPCSMSRSVRVRFALWCHITAAGGGAWQLMCLRAAGALSIEGSCRGQMFVYEALMTDQGSDDSERSNVTTSRWTEAQA